MGDGRAARPRRSIAKATLDVARSVRQLLHQRACSLVFCDLAHRARDGVAAMLKLVRRTI
jgi:hypothetical protein